MKTPHLTRNTLISLAALAALTAVSASAARADCQVFGADFDRQIAESPEVRQGYSPTLTRDLRRLRDAALLLQTYGQEEACNSVGEAVRDIASNPPRPGTGDDAQRPDEAAATGTATQPSAETQQAAEGQLRDAPEETLAQKADEGQQQRSAGEKPDRQAREMKRVQSATPITELAGALRASDMIGADVRDMQAENLGEVYDLVLGETGQPAYVVLAHGGFLGVGEKLVAIPFDAIRVSPEGDVYYVDLNEQQIENAQSFDPEAFSWDASKQWRADNDAYFRQLGETPSRSNGN